MSGRVGLGQLSWLVPARWGFAMSATTADLRTVAPFAPQDDPLWAPTSTAWMFNLLVLVGTGAVLLGVARYRLRLIPSCGPRRRRGWHVKARQSRDPTPDTGALEPVGAPDRPMATCAMGTPSPAVG